MAVFDLVVAGGGIVGLATAYVAGSRFPHWRIGVLEKEPQVARHQSGRNSGVLHSGLYYKPGSLKARCCREGRAQLLALCRAAGLPIVVTGKLVLAASEDELPRLRGLLERAAANGVDAAWVAGEALRAIEPQAAGVAALHVPGAGVVDFPAVCRWLVERIRERDGEVSCGLALRSARQHGGTVRLRTAEGERRAARVVLCAGLHADRLARACGLAPAVRIVPVRGEYWEVSGPSAALCRALIYPVPDPALPFLGVHLTRGVDGRVECGPNAVPALAREGYTWGRIDLAELARIGVHAGTVPLLRRHGRALAGELRRSLSRSGFARAVQRLVPALDPADLVPAPAGVRAQAVSRAGELVDDFAIARSGRLVAVLNAPSPAATASLAIAGHIAEVLDG